MEAEARISARDSTGNTFAIVARKVDRMSAAIRRADAVGRNVASLAPRVSAVGRAADMANRGMLLAASRFVGPAAIGAAVAATAKASVTEFAHVERRMARIAMTADASEQAQGAALQRVQEIAQQTALPVENVFSGLEALVAQGRSLEESLAFLPTVAKTAQASGAGLDDMANSAGAIADQFGIARDKMQDAFDVMVAGGKAGKFELKDMASYLPSLAPAAAADGFKGLDGLRRVVGMLQIIRNQTGTAESAAVAMQNVFQKMETSETATKFSKFGINLRKEMDKARKSGKDLFETFIELSEKALHGDMSKIPQLFNDAQMQIGMRALLTQPEQLESLVASLHDVSGSVDRDFQRVMRGPQAAIDRLGNSWEHFKTSLGSGLDAGGLTTFFDAVAAKADATFQEIENRQGGIAKRWEIATQDGNSTVLGSLWDFVKWINKVDDWQTKKLGQGFFGTKSDTPWKDWLFGAVQQSEAAHRRDEHLPVVDVLTPERKKQELDALQGRLSYLRGLPAAPAVQQEIAREETRLARLTELQQRRQETLKRFSESPVAALAPAGEGPPTSLPRARPEPPAVLPRARPAQMLDGVNVLRVHTLIASESSQRDLYNRVKREPLDPGSIKERWERWVSPTPTAERSYSRSPLVTRDMLSGQFTPPSMLGPLTARITEPLTAQVEGEIAVDNQVRVTFNTDLLDARIDSRVSKQIGNVQVRSGAAAWGGPGSNGKTMPEASATHLGPQ